MDASKPTSSQDWSALLDELKQKEGITSDAKLAQTLGITRGYICSVRKGRKRFSLDLVQAVFSRLGKPFDTDRLERLFVPVRVQRRAMNLATARKHVVDRAQGRCQLCGCDAPFKDSDGHPYLDVHFVVPFLEGGSDSPDNLVALCPNCHRRLEVSGNAADKRKLEKIAAGYKKAKRYQKREPV